MKFDIHGKFVEYSGEECGFFKFNGILWDFIDFDASMFMGGLGDIDEFEAIDKVCKMKDLVSEQALWDATPKPTIKSSFIEVKNPVPIDLVRDKVKNTLRLLDKILISLKS